MDLLSAPDLGVILDAVISRGHRSMVLDLAGLAFMDAAGLRVIAGAAGRLGLSGGALTIRSPSALVRRILGITGLAGLTQPELDHPAGHPGPDRQPAELPGVPVRAADSVSVSLRRHGRLVTVAVSDRTISAMDADQHATWQDPCVEASAGGRRFHAGSVDTGTRWAAFTPRARALGINAILSPPLLARETPAGALNIYSRTAAAFAAKDQNLASAFAAEASAILAGGRAEAADGQRARRLGGAPRSRQVIARADGVIRGAFPEGAGLRFAFGGGAVLWLAVMFARRSVPESPRWFIHGLDLSGTLITSGQVRPFVIAFLLPAVVWAFVAVDRFAGVRAAGVQRPGTARPLTAAVAGGASGPGPRPGTGRPGPGVLAVSAELLLARDHRERGDEERARAAGHRTAAHEQLALAAGGDERASRRAGTERLLAEMAEITALAHQERAVACDALADAEAEAGRHLAMAARERARAARDRARDHDAEALFAWQGADAGRHRALAVAAREWARSHEQRAQAQQLRVVAGSGPGGRPGAGRARADMHDLRAEMHAQRARSHELLAGHDEARAAAAATAADMLAEQARAAEAGTQSTARASTASAASKQRPSCGCRPRRHGEQRRGQPGSQPPKEADDAGPM